MQKGLATAVTIVQLNKRQFLLPTAVLRKHCPELRETLPETDETMTHLILNGISEAAFEVFSDYFRTGREPDLNIQNVVDVYCAANDLGIAPLKTKCWERVFGNLRREDQALILFVEFGRISVSPENVHKLMTVITMNFRKIVNSDSFLQLTARQVTQLLTYRPIREQHGIDALFKAGMRWLHADCRGRFTYANFILKSIGDLAQVSIIRDLPICPTIARAAELDVFKLAPIAFESPATKLTAVTHIGGGSIRGRGMDTSTPPSLKSPQNSPKNRSRGTKKKSKKSKPILKPVFSKITVRSVKYDKMLESVNDSESSMNPKPATWGLFPKGPNMHRASTKAAYVQTSMTSHTERNLPADRTDSSSMLKKKAKAARAAKASKSSKKGSKSSAKKKQSSKSRRNNRLKSPSSESTRAEREPANKKSSPAEDEGSDNDEVSPPKEISGAPVPRRSMTFPPPQPESTSTDEFMRLAHNDQDGAPTEPTESAPKSDTVFRSAKNGENSMASKTASMPPSKQSDPNANSGPDNFETKNPPVSPADAEPEPGPAPAKNASGGRVSSGGRSPGRRQSAIASEPVPSDDQSPTLTVTVKESAPRNENH